MNCGFSCMFFTFRIVTTVFGYKFLTTKPCVVCSLWSRVDSPLIEVHLFGIIHLPHRVVSPFHRVVIVNFSAWRKSATVVVI